MQDEKQARQREANPLRYLFSKTWHYSAGNRKKVVLYWIMFIMAETFALIFTPLAIAKWVDIIDKQGITTANIRLLFELLLLPLVIELIFWMLHGPGRVIERENSFKVRANYRKKLLRGVLTLPTEWHVEHHSGDTIDKIEKGTTALFQFSETTFEVIYAVVQLIVSYGMLAYFSHSAAYTVLGMMLVAAWITMRFDKILIAQYGLLNQSENAIAESVFDAVSNITTVIILRVERLVFGAIVRKIENPYKIFQSNSRLNEIKWGLTNFCCNITRVLVLGCYLWQHLGSKPATLMASLYILMRYLDNIRVIFFQFTSIYGEILQRKAKVMNAELLSKDFRPQNFTNHVLPTDWKVLRIDNLTFSYQGDDGDDLHLDGVSLKLTRGERIALVGGSGSGKTTLLKIMRDLYHPQSTTLSVDGNIIPQGFAGIEQAIALATQDPELFAESILYNITMGVEYSPDFVRRFTDMACFTEVVERLPKGLASTIKEKGVNLSVGQKQRLALARALLACHNKDIVLLDEPTSSLDTQNAAKIYQNIFREFEDKTIISSIHQLHLLPLFNRVCFMSDGKIIASGSLDELLAGCPEFIGVWRKYHEQHEVSAA